MYNENFSCPYCGKSLANIVQPCPICSGLNSAVAEKFHDKESDGVLWRKC